MDPLSITGAVIGIVQLLGACIKLTRRHIGHARQTSSIQDLITRLEELNRFNYAITVLQSYLSMANPGTYMEDIVRYYNQVYLTSFQSALLLLEQHRSPSFMRRLFSDRKYDKELKQAIDLALGRQQALLSMVLLLASTSQMQRHLYSDVDMVVVQLSERKS